MARKTEAATGEAQAKPFNLEAFEVEMRELKAKELKGRKLTAENNVNIGNLLIRIDREWKAAPKGKPTKAQLNKALGVNAAEWSRLTKLATWALENEKTLLQLEGPKGDGGKRADAIMEKLYKLRQGDKADKAKADKAKGDKAEAKAEAKAEKAAAYSKETGLKIADGVAFVLDMELTDEQRHAIANMAAELIERHHS